MSSTLDSNKVNVIAFYNMMFNDCQPAEAIATSQAVNTFSTTPMWRTESRRLLITLREWQQITPANV